MNKLIRKYKLMKTAKGFQGSEKKKLDFCFEKITGRPGWILTYLKSRSVWSSRKDDIKSFELNDDPPELIMISNLFWLFL